MAKQLTNGQIKKRLSRLRYLERLGLLWQKTKAKMKAKIKEQAARISTLEAENAELAMRIANLEKVVFGQKPKERSSVLAEPPKKEKKKEPRSKSFLPPINTRSV